MKRLRYLIFWTISLGLLGCEIKPSEINYGSDSCNYCKMSIVDPQHAGQIVTEKGKSFKYDAIECMLNHLREWDQAKPRLYLVTTFDQPKTLVDASQAHYLISPSIPSPMGEFLSAFQEEESRSDQINGQEDIALSWQELKKEFELD